MVADVQAIDIRRQQRAQAVAQGRALRQCLIDQQAVGLPNRFAPLLQGVEDALGADNHILDPARHILGPGRFWREIGHFVAPGQRDVHLGDASSGLRHIAQIGDLLLAFAGMFARRQQTLLIDKAIEIGRRHGPCIALILDEGMNDGDGASLVALDQFDAAEQRRAHWQSPRLRSGTGRSRSRD